MSDESGIGDNAGLTTRKSVLGSGRKTAKFPSIEQNRKSDIGTRKTLENVPKNQTISGISSIKGGKTNGIKILDSSPTISQKNSMFDVNRKHQDPKEILSTEENILMNE